MPTGLENKLSRVVLGLFIGPLAIAIILGCANERIISLEQLPAVLSAVGGLWGLTVGILRRSLLRALIGLNLGAVLILFWGKFAVTANDPVAVLALALAGSILGCALNMKRIKILKSAGVGALYGAISFGATGSIAVILFRKIDRGPRWLPEWFMAACFLIVPFTIGAALFLWLLVDVAERKNASDQK